MESFDVYFDVNLNKLLNKKSSLIMISLQQNNAQHNLGSILMEYASYAL